MDFNDVPLRLAALLFAILPALVVFVYFAVAARQDVRLSVFWNAFAFGGCSVIPVLALGDAISDYLVQILALPNSSYANSFELAVLEAAIPEELAKLLALLIIVTASYKTLYARQVLVAGVACSCGFALIENIFYIFSSNDWGMLSVKRSVSAVPGHAFVGAVMGYCLYQARSSSINILWWSIAILAPIILHGAYDFFLFASDYLKVQYQDSNTSERTTMMSLFILTVITEGLLAHWLLSISLGVAKFENKQQRVIKRVLTPLYHANFWRLLGLVCAVMSAFLVSLLSWSLMTFGYTLFALLHALCFMLLASRLTEREMTQSLIIAGD